ncbi:MAG TPA: metalloregulator ArsR/SmtB family transcription factor [Methylophilaceae bacterium]|nr:metalloregulator ArsR/SmtB family transcription factor [Methylophilaceae bacterium]
MKTLKQIPQAWKEVSDLFVALGDEHRQRILLAFEPGERLNIGQIVAASVLSRTAVTHHLKVLQQGGVLQSEKVGKEVYFWLDKDSMIDGLQCVLDYIKTQI